MSARAEAIADLICGAVDRGEWETRSRIPPVRSLASSYLASPKTVLEAIRICVSRGVLSAVPGGRGYVCSSRRSDPVTWGEGAANRLGSRIWDSVSGGGALLDGEYLLQKKQLMARLHCGRKALDGALEVLRRRGLLVAEGRHCRLNIGKSPSRSSSRVYFAGHPALFTIFFHQYLAALLTLESKVRELGWGNLRYHLVEDPLRAPAPPRREVAAFVHLNYTRRGSWQDFFDLRPRIPVVVLDPGQLGDIGLTASGRKIERKPRSNRLWITSDNFRAGLDVAGYLASSGHRRVAIFNHVHGDVERYRGWLGPRLTGLRETFPAPPAQSAFGTSELFEPVSGPNLASGSSGIALSLMNRLLRHLTEESSWPRSFTESAFGDLRTRNNVLAIREVMNPLFERATRDPSFTAWVCINDECAAAAHAFMAVLPPSRRSAITLVSFDNSAIAHLLGITSYDMDLPQMAHRAAFELAFPGCRPAKSHRMKVIRGHLVVRS